MEQLRQQADKREREREREIDKGEEGPSCSPFAFISVAKLEERIKLSLINRGRVHREEYALNGA